MRLLRHALLIGAVLIGISQAATFAELAAELPACGLLCMETAISASSCTLSNATCICTDTTLTASVTACIATSCTIKEQLQVAKIQEEGCGVAVVSKQTELKIISYIFCILAEICIVIRICTKLKLNGKLTADDWVIILSGFALIPYFYLLIAITDLGLGLNMWDTDLDQLDKFFRFFWAEEIVYLNLLGITKMSLLLFLVKIFPSRSFRMSCWALGFVVAGTTFSFTMSTIFSCRPISYFWTQWQGLGDGACTNENLQTYVAGGINIVQDFAILILPLPNIYKLQVSLKKKIQLLLMFSVGLFVSIISIIRIQSLFAYGATTNPTYDYVTLVIWSILELTVAVICACMPSLRQLFGHLSSTGFFANTTKGLSSNSSRGADKRIYQSRSFRIESKLRSQNDNFHELASVTNVGSRDTASDHTPGKLTSISNQGSQTNLNGNEDGNKDTAHVWVKHQSTA